MLKFKTLLIGVIFTLIYSNIYCQWEHVLSPGSRIMSIKQFGNKMYVGTEYSGVWLKKNDTGNFIKLPTSGVSGNYEVKDFAAIGDKIFVGSRGAGVYYSEDGENNWQYFNEGFETQAFISKIIIINDAIFAANSTDIGLQPSGIYLSPIDSSNWKIYGTGIPTALLSISSFIVTDENEMYIGTQLASGRGNIFVSQDNGKSWNKKLIENNFDVNSLFSTSGKVFAGTGNGVYFTSKSDSVWHKFSNTMPGYYVDDLIYFNNRLYSAVDGEGIIVSEDNGVSWKNINLNLPIDEEYAGKLYISGDYLYAGLGLNNGLWKLPLSVLATPYEQQNPIGFKLQQNYPNPFNPSTLIRFQLPQNSDEQLTKLLVYDILGNQVAELLNEIKNPGKYEVNFDGFKLSSGVYFYKLTFGKFSSVKKMLFLK